MDIGRGRASRVEGDGKYSWLLKNGDGLGATSHRWPPPPVKNPPITLRSAFHILVLHPWVQPTADGVVPYLLKTICMWVVPCSSNSCCSRVNWGLPWWRSGWDSTLPMPGAWVQSLVRELDPTCMLQLRVLMPQLGSPHVSTKEPASHN